MLDARHSSNTPLHRKINLLLLPILEKDHAPQAVYDSVEAGELAQNKPGTKPKCRRKQQKLKVCLQEGEVESDGLPEFFSYLVDVAVVKEVFGAPLLDPMPVERVVV